MTEAQYNEAKRLAFRIARLEIFIKNIGDQDHFCNAADGVHEKPETTEAAKKILIDDLNQRLAEEQAAFDAL